MAINDISLTAGMRSNLISLQSTAQLLNKTQERLASGKKVNSALDNPIAYFASRAHLSRANDIASLKDGMGEAIQTIKAADSGIKALTDLIETAKALGNSALGASKNQIKVQFTALAAGASITVGGDAYSVVASEGAITDPATEVATSDDVATVVSRLAALINANEETTEDMLATASGSTLILNAKAADVAITEGNYTTYVNSSGIATAEDLTDTDSYHVFSERRALATQYNTMMQQIDAVANSSGYKGVNLLMDQDLNVAFEGTSLNVKGFSSTASDLQLNTTATTTGGGDLWGWTLNSDISIDVGKLDVGTATLRSESQKMSNNLSIINIQQEFSTKMVSTLTIGADNLTLADMNEEGANMLMLQTRQSLSTTALSLSSQAAQSVLRLFG